MARKPSEDTNNLLADSLRSLIEVKSIDKISIKEITDGCGLNRQTFYYHFKDIYDLVHWIFFKNLEQMVAGSREIDSWEGILRYVLETLDGDRHYYMAIYGSTNFPTMRVDFMEYVSTAIQKRMDPEFDELGLDDVYRGFLSRLYSLVLLEFVEKWHKGYSYSTMEQFIENFSRVIEEQMTGAKVLGRH